MSNQTDLNQMTPADLMALQAKVSAALVAPELDKVKQALVLLTSEGQQQVVDSLLEIITDMPLGASKTNLANLITVMQKLPQILAVEVDRLAKVQQANQQAEATEAQPVGTETRAVETTPVPAQPVTHDTPAAVEAGPQA